MAGPGESRGRLSSPSGSIRRLGRPWQQ